MVFTLRRNRSHQPRGISYLLLRDGTLYFVPVTILAAIVVYCAVKIDNNSSIQVITAFFFPPLQNICVNRLVLSLRSTAAAEDFHHSTYGPSTYTFSSGAVLANIGAPLDVEDRGPNCRVGETSSDSTLPDVKNSSDTEAHHAVIRLRYSNPT